MRVQCPKCGRAIDAEHMNVATDVAVCPGCAETYRLSELSGAAAGPGQTVDLSDPPSGSWFRPMFDGFEVGATTRHPIAFFLVPFMLVWSGGSLGGIYGGQIARGKFELWLCLFGIPFLIGSLIFWWIALMAIWGKVVVTVDRDQGVVFTGLGSVGWRRRFTWSEVARATEAIPPFHYPGMRMGSICLEGRRRIRFGTGLSEDRRYFVLEVLRQMLAERDRRGGRGRP
jgi:hypothetical protein